jgi:hypothetical protein
VIFKGIRKGKTLKDTLAVFKVVEGTWVHLDNPSVQMTDTANYKIGERTIPLPKLERMITAANKKVIAGGGKPMSVSQLRKAGKIKFN